MKPERSEPNARKLPRLKGRGTPIVQNRWQAKPPHDPAEFNRLLLATWPKEGGTWFMAVWEPGEPGDPVERWMLYEMCPIEHLDPDIAAEFKGQNPAELTLYDSVRNVVVPQTTITRQQWKLYHETGACGRVAWVVQGEHGGHKRFFTQIERRILRMLGRPTEPPLPGELPYAPLDERVISQLLVHDRMRKHAYTTDIAVRLGKLSREEGQRELRRYLVKWLGEQSEEWEPEAHRRVASEMRNTPRVDRQWDADYESACEAFIESGQFTPARRTASPIILLR